MFRIEAWRAAEMLCHKFNPVMIGRGGGHISVGTQSGVDELASKFAHCYNFSVLFGKVLVIGCACGG